MELDMIFAVILTALGGLSFIASNLAKKEKWFRLFVALGVYWEAWGVIHLIMAVRK